MSAAKGPVFVLGCPRSGTTVLYHMLLSAGNFAIYRAESNVFSVLVPRFGNFRSEQNRRRLMRYWLQSKLFQVSGLDAKQIEDRIMRDCRSGGDFLRILMESVAAKQGMSRWADCTPDHLLYLDEIRHQVPDAHIIHIIRDGRDVALSYVKQGWSYPMPWDRAENLSGRGIVLGMDCSPRPAGWPQVRRPLHRGSVRGSGRFSARNPGEAQRVCRPGVGLRSYPGGWDWFGEGAQLFFFQRWGWQIQSRRALA